MTGTEGAADHRNGWHRVTRALLAGLVAESAMFSLIAVAQTPGLDPPPESAALFIAATTAGVVGYQLSRGGDGVGYLAAVLAAAVAVAVVGVLVAGIYGPAGPRTNPVGPLSYVALAVGTAVAAGVAWRRGDATATGSVPGPTS